MRVITGKAKHILLDVPVTGTRPLTDRIKTSIFDLIRDFVPNANVLDLYAGSGGFGIEALSRGARSGTFVDLSSEAEEVITNNLIKTKFIEQGRVVRFRVNDFIVNTDEKFDIIFLDPPFDAENDEDFTALDKILSDDGILVYRLPKYKKPDNLPIAPLTEVYRKKYGQSIVLFLKK